MALLFVGGCKFFQGAQSEAQKVSEMQSDLLDLPSFYMSYKGVSMRFPDYPEQYLEQYDYISYPINVWFTATHNGVNYTVHFSNSETINFYNIEEELLPSEMLKKIEKNAGGQYTSQYRYIDSKKVLEYNYVGYTGDCCHKDFVLNSDTYVQIEVRVHARIKVIC